MLMIFPGMDPYLENPEIFSGIHTRTVVYLADQMAPILRPRYIASVGERVYVEGPADRPIGPDVWIRETRREAGGLAVADAAVMDDPWLVEASDLEVHEPYIEILDRQSDMQVVTVIELVSPSNKYSGPGRELYLTKQKELRWSRIPLAGDDPDVPLDIRAALEQAYQAGSYRDRIDYRSACQPPLTPDNQAWADELIQAAGQ